MFVDLIFCPVLLLDSATPHLLLFGFLNLNDTRTTEFGGKVTDLSQRIRSIGVSP
jgi:hypothetical protein